MAAPPGLADQRNSIKDRARPPLNAMFFCPLFAFGPPHHLATPSGPISPRASSFAVSSILPAREGSDPVWLPAREGSDPVWLVWLAREGSVPVWLFGL